MAFEIVTSWPEEAYMTENTHSLMHMEEMENNGRSPYVKDLTSKWDFWAIYTARDNQEVDFIVSLSRLLLPLLLW